MFLKYKSFIVPLLFFLLIATIFPPTVENGSTSFSFLLSNNYDSISWDRLLLIYLLFTILSIFIHLAYSKSNVKFISLSSYIISSLIISILFYFLFPVIGGIFAPSLQPVNDSKSLILSKYDIVIDVVNDNFPHKLIPYGPYEVGEVLLEIFNTPSHKWNKDQWYIYNSLTIPGPLYPSLKKYYLKYSPRTDNFKSGNIIWDTRGISMDILPDFYDKTKIPENVMINTVDFQKDLDSIKYNYYNNYLSSFFDYYNLESEYLANTESYWNIMMYTRLILTFLMFSFVLFLLIIKHPFFT